MTDNRPIWRWIEVLSVLAIIGSTSAMAVPKYASLQRERVAARMIADVAGLRRAVYRFYSDSAYFPEPVAGEPAPPGLTAYLPATFRFARDYGTIEYRLWPVTGDPTRAAVQAPAVVGATIRVNDPRIGAMAATLAEPRDARFAVGNLLTFLFFGA